MGNTDKNKYEEMFDEFMNLVEFELIKCKNGNWQVVDTQGANLGDIESDTFKSAEDIFERMTNYIEDYIVSAIEEIIYQKKLDVKWSDMSDLIKKAKTLLPESKWDFDVLEMVCHHANEIDLNKCSYEELERDGTL